MTQTRPQSHLPRLITTVAAVGMLAAACGGYTPRLASIALSPDATVPVNETHQFTAVGRDSKGNLFQFEPDWAVVAQGGTINGTGLFTAGTVTGPYPQTVRVTSDGITAQATVVVTPATLVPTPPTSGLATITVTPVMPDSMPVGTTWQFEAVARDSNGAVVTMPLTWSVVAGGGTISSSGLFTAGTATGAFPKTIRANNGTIEGFTSVTVASSETSLATMREVVNFDYDKSDLTAESRTILDEKVKILGTNPAMRIMIVGHTDNRGTAAYNLALGTRRADAVKSYLVAAGVDASRIEIETRGETEPMTSGSSDGAMAQNRRDVFVILPKN